MFTTYAHLSRSSRICPPTFFCPLEDSLAARPSQTFNPAEFRKLLQIFGTPLDFTTPSASLTLKALGLLLPVQH